MSVRGTTRVCGVWGWPVKHSASPAMHNAAFAELGVDLIYVPFAVSPERLPEAVASIRALDLLGVNITVPLKELVPPLLDRLTARAARLGAVNTIFWEGSQLCGDSTDGPGILAALSSEGVVVDTNTKAVVLGAGGSARAVVDALVQAGAHVLVANRTTERAQELVARFGAAGALPLEAKALRTALKTANLLLNTTSIGMHPRETELPPVPPEALHSGIFVSDLIYNPVETGLLTIARQAGCRTQNGIEMLVQQGAIAQKYWTGMPAPLKIMRHAVQQALGIADRMV